MNPHSRSWEENMRVGYWVLPIVFFFAFHCGSQKKDYSIIPSDSQKEFENALLTESLTIQSGSHMKGSPETHIIPLPGKPALIIYTEPNSETIVENFSIETSSTAAVIITGNGSVFLKNINILFSSGYGIIAENLESLQMENVTINGPAYTPENVPLGKLNPKEFPITAIAVKNISELSFKEIKISSTLYFAFIIEQSKGTLSDIHIADCLKIGGNIQNSEIAIYDSEIEKIQRGFSFFEPYGLLVSNSTLTTKNLQIHDIEGHGLVQIQTLSTHENLSVFKNNETGVWIDNHGKVFSEKSLILKNSEIYDNHGSGLIIRNSDNILIDEVTVSNTFKLPSIVENKKVEFADGIQLIESYKNIQLSRIDLGDNKRVGLIVDPLSSIENLDSMSVDSISITCSQNDCAFGIAIQNVKTKPDWNIQNFVTSESEVNIPVFEAKQFAAQKNLLSQKNLIGTNGIIDPQGKVDELGLIDENGL